MSAKFDLASLFESTLYPDEAGTAPYSTLAAELDAVRTRRKAMSYFASTRGYFETSNDFVRLFAMVVDRGLTLIIAPGKPQKLPQHLQPVDGFILHHDQAWRVPAFRALWETAFEDGSWTNAAEIQASVLLGYTAKERGVWMTQRRWQRAAWGCRTIYTLLTREQRDRVVALGKRCVGPADSLAGMNFFVHAREHQMRKHATKLVPKGLTIARVALEHDTAWKLFGHPKDRKRRRGSVLCATVAKQLAPTINSTLRSNVEFLNLKGWA